MKKKTVIFYTAITLIFFGMLIKLEYATDTYSVFNFSGEEIYTHFAGLGRFVSAVIGKFVKSVNMPENIIYIFSYLLAIICAILSQYKLNKIIEKDVESRLFQVLIPTLIILNPFSIELFLFIEKGIMWFGILMCILALENLIKYLDVQKDNENFLKDNFLNKYLIYALLFMFIANCSYQGIVGIFVAISTVYLIKYSKNIKQFLINNIIVGFIYAIPASLDFILMKLLFKANRVNGEIVLSKSIEKIYSNTINMFKYMYNLLPKYVFILAILFTFAVFCYKIWKDKNKIIEILKFVYIILGVTLIAVLPQIMQSTEAIWFMPRSTYCFASLYGILILYLFMNYNMKNISKTVILCISIILIFLQLKSFIKIEKDRYLLNNQDYQISMQIIDKINKYEEETENKIDKIEVYQDSSLKYTYDDIFVTGDMNIKSYSSDWSTVAILNYYLKRNLKLIKQQEYEKQKFLEKNWDEFSEEQIMFKDDILILCNY